MAASHTHKYEHIHISLVSPQSHTCLKRYWFGCLFKVLALSPTRPSECFFHSCLNLIRFPKRRKHTADEASERRGIHERGTLGVPEKGNSLEFTTQQTSFLVRRDEARRETMGCHRVPVSEEVFCKASGIPYIRLTDESQSRPQLTSFGLELLSITASVTLALGLLRAFEENRTSYCWRAKTADCRGTQVWSMSVLCQCH